jgi:hypothetical protein
MFSFSFNRNRLKLKQLLGIRARLALLAVILVTPLMLERVRSLEGARPSRSRPPRLSFHRWPNTAPTRRPR